MAYTHGITVTEVDLANTAGGGSGAPLQQLALSGAAFRVGEAAAGLILNARPTAFRTVVGGALPPGVTLDLETMTLAGTPTLAGNYAVTVRQVDETAPNSPLDSVLAIAVEPGLMLGSLEFSAPHLTDAMAPGAIVRTFTGKTADSTLSLQGPAADAGTLALNAAAGAITVGPEGPLPEGEETGAYSVVEALAGASNSPRSYDFASVVSVHYEGPPVLTAPAVLDAGLIAGTRGIGLSITGPAPELAGTPAPTPEIRWEAYASGLWGVVVGEAGLSLTDTELTTPLPLRRGVRATNSVGSTDWVYSNILLGLTIETPPPEGSIPTTLQSSVEVDGITFTFSAPLPVGWYGPKRPFVVNASGVTITSITPAAMLYTAATGTERSGWVHGAEVNPGCEGSQRIGKPNSSADRDSLHGLDERGSTSPGTNSTNFTGQGAWNSMRSSPPELTAGGYTLNRDPGYTGNPITIEAGTPAVIGKARSDVTATAATSRLLEYAELCVVTEAPPLGAAQLGAARPDLGHRIFATDIDLTGLLNAAPPAGYTHAAANYLPMLQRPYHQAIMLGGESQRYNRANLFQAAYGRDTANQFSNAAMLLHTNLLTPAEKQEVAWCFVQQALAVRDRIDAGGDLSNNGIGAQQHQWSLVLAVAAWLTRNSARGQIFRDLMPGGALAAKNLIHISNARAIQQADWVAKTQVEGRNVPSGGEKTYYESLQCRPFMEGSVWAYSDPGRPGSGVMSGRFDGGTRAYVGQQFLSNFGMARFLTLAPGGRAMIDRADFWTFYDIVADIQLYHRQFGNSSNSGLWYREGSIIGGGGSRLGFFERQAFDDANWQWPQPAAAAPVVSSVGFSSFDALQECITAGSFVYEFKEEQWVWVIYSQHLSREVARMPVKSGVAITVNGEAIALDEVGARTAGDPRTNGAIQIRGRAVAFALSPADLLAKLGRSRLIASDVVRVTTTFAADAASRPRTLDNQFVPEVTAAAASWTSASRNRPAALELVSFGGRAADDTPKMIKVANNAAYVQAKYGLEATTNVEGLLVGARLKLSPAAASRITNAALVGRGAGGSDFGIRMGSTTAFSSRWPTTGGTRNGGWSLAYSAADDDVLLNLWFHAQTPNAGGLNRHRKGATVGAEVPLTPAGDFRWTSIVGNQFGILGFPLGTSGFEHPLRASLREFYMAVGTPLRPLPVIDLNAAVFSEAQDWGGRGQNVLPARADYAGYADGGIPEFYFCPTLEEARLNSFPNYGLFALLAGTFDDPEYTQTWISGG